VIAIWSRPYRPQRPAPPAIAAGDADSRYDVQALVARGAVKTERQVDQPARYIPGTAVPVYPDSVLRGGKAGRVVLEFVVDTAGGVELPTIGLVSTTHSALTDAVRQVIGNARFAPASIGSIPVRQVVRLTFDFAPQA
jgi:TonB family protein